MAIGGRAQVVSPARPLDGPADHRHGGRRGSATTISSDGFWPHFILEFLPLTRPSFLRGWRIRHLLVRLAHQRQQVDVRLNDLVQAGDASGAASGRGKGSCAKLAMRLSSTSGTASTQSSSTRQALSAMGVLSLSKTPDGKNAVVIDWESPIVQAIA